MKKTIFFVFVMIYLAMNIETKKVSRSRSSGSGRGSPKKTNYNPQPAPTSLSYPQASAPKPSLFGWQEKPAPKTQNYSPKQSNPTNVGHSYPSSNTGLSGNTQPKQTVFQENMQRSNVPNQQNAQHANIPTNNQLNHNYPSSNGLSGNTGSGGNYPQGSGLSGSNIAPPAYPGQSAGNVNRPQGTGVGPGAGYPQGSGLSNSNSASSYGNNAPRSPYPQSGTNYPHNNPGNNNAYPQGAPPPYTNVGNNLYHQHQGPPPPYTNYGHNYGGYGGSGPYSPQMPGYFGNYMGNNKGFGGVSRGGSALAGVGIAGAGIGTVLTGLALWNLARSTGHSHHTVIYDNRGQPVAVAPNNDTAPATDPILGDLVNCTLTISNDNATEVIAIPCSIATSFTPEADVKDPSVDKDKDTQDNTKCTITVVTKTAKEFMTTIPCSVLLNTAAQNNVTEQPVQDSKPEVAPLPPTEQLHADQPSDILTKPNIDSNAPEQGLNCSREEGEIRDPINPCFSVKHDLTVLPLQTTEKQEIL